MAPHYIFKEIFMLQLRPSSIYHQKTDFLYRIKRANTATFHARYRQTMIWVPYFSFKNVNNSFQYFYLNLFLILFELQKSYEYFKPRKFCIWMFVTQSRTQVVYSLDNI